MKYFRKKTLFIILVICLCVLQLYLYMNNGETYVIELDVRKVHMNHQQRSEKLVTIFTTFVDVSNLPNSDYRFFVQSNFLRMTNFESFKRNAHFIIYTNSPIFKSLITQEYPNVIVFPSPMRGDFNTPMLKDLFLTAERLYPSLFYMYANADNLYDSSLIHTLFQVRKTWETGLMRQKILIVGQRRNAIIQEAVENEATITKYFENSTFELKNAQDYFIVTKDSIEWILYPEVLVGRRAYDNMLVDFGMHNELETIDATTTIRVIHQSEKETKHSSDDFRNKMENSWNFKLGEFHLNHWSTTCARYKTMRHLDETKAVQIFDKKNNAILYPSERAPDYFSKEHEYWLEFGGHEVNKHAHLTPSLVVTVLAYNKPESLSRLLKSLGNIGNSAVRIDLIISLDMGHLGYHDLPTLMVAKKFEWLHGRKKLVLKNSHRGQLHQWLDAYSSVDGVDEETLFLVLEDCMMLSPQWYDYVSAVLSHDRVRMLRDKVAGWTLETPIVRQRSIFAVSWFNWWYASHTSLVLGGIKRVRSFIPNIRLWKGFIRWFQNETKTLKNDLLSHTLAARLENRGAYTNWASEMWVTWFSYYLEKNHPQIRYIGYIITRRGFLSEKMQTIPLDQNTAINCYSNEVLISEMGVQYSKTLLNYKYNNSIQIPQVIPKIRIENL